jgi:amino-acid N-acetyltransferase
MVRLREASHSDLDAIQALLQRCELPPEGLEDQLGPGYVLALADDQLVAVAGIEVYGDAGLLRSVAVDPGWRGRGLGERLTRERMEWARQRGLDTVYLLTTSASDWFPRLGFETVSRDTVPEAIRASLQFASVCPSTATVMAARVAYLAPSVAPAPLSSAPAASSPAPPSTKR